MQLFSADPPPPKKTTNTTTSVTRAGRKVKKPEKLNLWTSSHWYFMTMTKHTVCKKNTNWHANYFCNAISVTHSFIVWLISYLFHMIQLSMNWRHLIKHIATFHWTERIFDQYHLISRSLNSWNLTFCKQSENVNTLLSLWKACTSLLMHVHEFCSYILHFLLEHLYS